VFAEHIIGDVTKHHFRAAIPSLDDAIIVQRDYRVRRVGANRREHSFLFARGLDRALLLARRLLFRRKRLVAFSNALSNPIERETNRNGTDRAIDDEVGYKVNRHRELTKKEVAQEFVQQNSGEHRKRQYAAKPVEARRQIFR